MAEARDMPLFAWGEALRRDRHRRRQLRRRAGLLCAGLAALLATVPAPPRPRLVWNASASAPIGLYAVAPGAPVARGDMVVAWPPAAARALAVGGLYLAPRVPLVKRAAAVAGDTVCAKGAAILVDGGEVARRRAADRLGRPLPWWHGCRRLGPGELLLLMAEQPASFDGRYFGPVGSAETIGRARLLWRG